MRIDRKRLDEKASLVRDAVAAADLPRDIQDKIVAVVSRARLGAEDRLDVALELIAHFQDGLAAGKPSPELLEAFGDGGIAAQLITRTRRRTRSRPREMEHDMSGDSMFSTLWQNLRYAGRRLAQSPGFTSTAILSLALGIGANTAMFSLVNAVLIRQPPFEKPEELVDIFRTAPDFPYGTFSHPDFEDLRDQAGDVFSAVSASSLALVQLDREESVQTAWAQAVSGTHFSMLGLQPEVGRVLLPEDDIVRGGHPVAMLGYGYWQRAFGGAPEIVGREIRIGGRFYTVVGVAPADYPGTFPGVPAAVFVPRMMVNELEPGGEDDLESRAIQSLFVKGRLRPGVTITQAQSRVDAVADHLRELDLEDFDPDTGFQLVPSEDVTIFPALDRYIHAAAWLLMAVVGLVLFITCTNLASFLLARGADRRKETALCMALGATRGTLMLQLLSETILLGLAGGVTGLATALVLLRILVTADLPLPIPITLDLSLDATVLGFSFGVSLAAGVVMALAPALRSTNPDVASTLRDESTGGGQRGRLTLRNALVVAQVAGSLVLLVGAGLFLRSFQQAQSVDPGFGREPTAILSLMVPADRFSEEEGRAFMRAMVDRCGALPGVEAVGLIGNLHLNTVNRRTMSINVDGVEPPPEREFHTIDYSAIDPGFFDAAGMRILRGRTVSERDLPHSPQVAVVNQTLAENFWPGEDPVGRTIRRLEDPDLTVIGVVSDAKIRTLGEPPRPFIYRPYGQSYPLFVNVLARTLVDPQRTALDMLAAGRDIDPELFVFEAKTMERHLAVQLLPARLSALILGAFAALSLLLAVIGLYGIVSYAVSRRTREVGIRMSLGADRSSVIRTLMGSGMKLVAVGGGIGLALALAVARLLRGLLFNVSSLDVTTFLLVPAVLGAAAMVAAYIPARRASRVDPAAALRAE